ncbi:hypothetical protein K2Z84_27040 [Candidatus Binatia bacterium]|jgi:hypothetical protein|nr:hypothetical protein [Candidatus Binatia bacterium]
MTARPVERSAGERVPSRPSWRATVVVLVPILVLGAVLRLDGIDRMALWVDEAAIANVVSRGDLAAYAQYPASNRPFGYLVLSGWLATLHNSAVVLRSTSAVPALIAMLLVVAIARMMLHSPVLVALAASMTALNGWLVAAAKEFKPYALEHALLLGWIAAILALRRSGSRLALALLLASLPIGPLLGHAPTFALPICGALAFAECRRRGWASAAVSCVLVTTCGCVLAVLQFVWIGSNTPPALFGSWSASFYDVASGLHPLEVAIWVVGRVALLLRAFVPMARDPAWDGSPSAQAFERLCIAGVVAALVRLVARREWALMALLVGPLLPPLALGLVARWPFGPERVNLFATTLLLLLVLLGWEALVERVDRRWVVPAFAALFVLLQLPLDASGLRHKDTRYGVAQEDVTLALDEIAAREPDFVPAAGPRPALVCNGMSGYAMRYYLAYDQSQGPRIQALLFGRRVDWVPRPPQGDLGGLIRQRLREFPLVWVLLSHYGEDDLAAARASLSDVDVEVVVEREFSGVMLLGARLRREARGAAATPRPAHAPRSTCPGSAPVCLPSSSTTAPLTITAA